MTAVQASPIAVRIPPRRQAAARHYGCHPYFTRRAWNVVQAYIEHFTRPGEIVLDPFGGSGVTAIEALVLGRTAVHVDINPLANFITQQVAVSPVSIAALSRAFQSVKAQCAPQLRFWQRMPDTFFETEAVPFWYPMGIRLPQNADVELVEELFTRRQLFSLSLILHAISAVTDPTLRELLRFCFSATLAKTNRTFMSARNRAASRGGSSILSIYRYHVPRKPVELDPWHQFAERFRNLLRCKAETNALIGDFFAPQTLRVFQASASDMTAILHDNSVDYVFTDPPYGAHIAYLDLSTLWNAWLGLKVSESDRKKEAIEGGELHHSRGHYVDLLRASIAEIHRVLKPGRWLSLVFEHGDATLYSTIINAAEEAGLHYVNAVLQSASVVWSMHKKKNPMRVLTGELIINFRKGTRHASRKTRQPCRPLEALLTEVAAAEARRREGATTEDIYNRVMLRLLESGTLQERTFFIDDLIAFLQAGGYTFDKQRGRWTNGPPNSRRAEQKPLF